MSNVAPDSSAKSASNVSYLRTIDRIEAVAAQVAISQFFGRVQDPPHAAPKPPKVVREPKYAMWIIGGGIALLVAAVLTVALREYLPQTMPGLYLGIGGLIVIVVGAIYAKLGAENVEQELTPEKKAEIKAQDQIVRQIEHFQKHADAAFGPPPKSPEEGSRAHLVGIGRKEWNGNHEVPIVEVKGERIWAAVVHLLSIDLTPKQIAIKQAGLHLATGTIHSETTIRCLLTDVMTASHEERKLVSTVSWEAAAKIAKKIAELDTKANKGIDKIQAEVTKLKKELAALPFEEPAGNKFVLTFASGDRIELRIADSDHPNNKSDYGFPIGGKANLDAAIRMWNAINIACEAAKDAHHTAVTGVKDGLDTYQNRVVTGLTGVQNQLASLEHVMKQVLIALQAQPLAAATTAPIMPSAAVAASAPAAAAIHLNGSEAPAPVATTTAAAQPPQTEPAKSEA